MQTIRPRILLVWLSRNFAQAKQSVILERLSLMEEEINLQIICILANSRYLLEKNLYCLCLVPDLDALNSKSSRNQTKWNFGLVSYIRSFWTCKHIAHWRYTGKLVLSTSGEDHGTTYV
uniref:Uncharacterized protein n=1 Tax=Cacopsylla melanoneura TaxID=428564 RepID=A0A8D9B0R1_9HEMI